MGQMLFMDIPMVLDKCWLILLLVYILHNTSSLMSLSASVRAGSGGLGKWAGTGDNTDLRL